MKFITATLLFFLAGTVELSAQNVVARVAGLEENKDYMELLRGDERLRSFISRGQTLCCSFCRMPRVLCMLPVPRR